MTTWKLYIIKREGSALGDNGSKVYLFHSKFELMHAEARMEV